MPLGKNVSKNIEELYADNQKSGKERGANGKPRSRAQIIAIAESAARRDPMSGTRKQYHASKGTQTTKGGMGIINKVLGGRFG